jgi:LysM repeat protein
MTKTENPQKYISSYRKQQKFLPYIAALAVLLVTIGLIILFVWLTGPNRGGISLFATDTLTPTITSTATEIPPTATETLVPTDTLPPTETLTYTPSGPFQYKVQEDDNCWSIAEQFGVELDVLLAINSFTDCPIQPNDVIWIPGKDQQLPTETPIPSDMPRGTKLDYTVKTGDTIQSIASKFNSLIDDIIDENKLTDANAINAGQVLVIRVNLATATPTQPPSSTPGFLATTVQPTATQAATN